MNELKTTNSGVEGDDVGLLNPLIWKVVIPVVVKVPETFSVFAEMALHDPPKSVSAEHVRTVGTWKYEGMLTCKYPGATTPGSKFKVKVISVSR